MEKYSLEWLITTYLPNWDKQLAAEEMDDEYIGADIRSVDYCLLIALIPDALKKIFSE